MLGPRNNKAVTNESRHPYVVELAVISDELDSDALDVELNRRIIQFHKSRHIQPRYGRRFTSRQREIRYRWCFSDLSVAHAFVEQFGGVFCKPSAPKSLVDRSKTPKAPAMRRKAEEDWSR
jgi:hypothetical protein